jgi:nucleoside-diphosphate-sugar epimerase
METLLNDRQFTLGFDDKILLTGASGFIGVKVVETLLRYGFKNLRCFTRSSKISESLERMIESHTDAGIEVTRGSLLVPDDCRRAAEGVQLVYHLAGRPSGRSFSAANQDSVETLRCLLDALLITTRMQRFVHVSSFAVYSNTELPVGAMLDEASPVESRPELRGEVYCYAKIMQEKLLLEYAAKQPLRYVILRPGAVYGPGNCELSARIGILAAGLFLHLGGRNIIPLTYVDNCAEAIALAGLRRGIDQEVINVVDDDTLTSTEFLRLYKKHVGGLRSIYLPRSASYILFLAMGMLARLLKPGTPTKYSTQRWSAYWKGNSYTNRKAKRLLGWVPRVPMDEGLRRYFEYCQERRDADA